MEICTHSFIIIFAEIPVISLTYTLIYVTLSILVITHYIDMYHIILVRTAIV